MKRLKHGLALLAVTLLALPAVAASPTIYENNFNSYEDFDNCTILDKNNDGTCWDWKQNYAYCLGTESMLTSNDWLITPPVALENGHSYCFTVVTQCLGEKEEKFECKWGTGYHVEQLTMPAIPPTVMGAAFQTSAKAVDSQRIDIATDGEYRFAYHFMSEPYSTGVAVHSFKVVDLGLTADLVDEPRMIFNEQFESSASFIPFKTYDMNGDGAVWSHNNTKLCAQYTYSSRNQADDHLVTPAIPLQVGRNYKIKFKASSLSMAEKLEVLLGTTDKPGDMNVTLIEPTDIAKRSEVELSNNSFKVSASGDYYFSFHAISAADADKLYIDDIEIWDMEANGESGEIIDPYDNARTIPYAADMTLPATFAEYSVVDANYDGRTWKYDPIFNTTLYGYSPDRNADDWLITPQLKLEAGKTYRMTVTAASRGREFPERIEAKIGKGTDLDTYTETIIAPVEIIMNVGDPALRFQSEPINVDETSVWNLGIHAISNANMSDILVNSIEVEEVFPDAPRAVTELTAVADPTGLLKATLSFKAPTMNYGGNALIAPLTKIEVLRGEEVIKTLTNVQPGEAVTVEDAGEGIVEGMNQYSVLPYVGEHAGDIAQVNLFVGSDIPLKLTGIKGTDLGTQVELSWNPAETIGKNGGLVYPDLVKYNIYEAEPIYSFGIIVEIRLNYLTSVTGTTTAILDAPDMQIGTQTPVHYAITAATAAGESPAGYANFLKGKPYALPFEESFSGGAFSTYVDVDTDCIDANSGLYYSTNASDDDQGAVAFVSYDGDAYIAMFTGKFQILNTLTPTVTFDAKNAIGRNTLKVVAITPDNAHHDVYSVIPGEDYTKYTVDLSQFTNEIWLRLIFATEFPIYVDPDDGNELDLDNICVLDTTGVGSIFSDDDATLTFPCDVYSLDGKLLRKNAYSLDGLRGIVIVNGHKYMLR